MSLLGTSAALASLIVVLLGFPHQIYKNYKTKSDSGISPFFIGTVFVGYLLWSIYGWLKPDYFLAVAYTPGALFALILFTQLFYYRKK